MMEQCSPDTCTLIMSRAFFFFNDTATTEIYTLSLHDALPISQLFDVSPDALQYLCPILAPRKDWAEALRSEEHTSELQSRLHLVCRLLLEKKKKRGSSKAECPSDHDLVVTLSPHITAAHRGLA